MRLTPTQQKCLKAIAQQSGHCPKGYRFNSAAVLARSGLIKGELHIPYWWWDLTDEGRRVLGLIDSSCPQEKT